MSDTFEKEVPVTVYVILIWPISGILYTPTLEVVYQLDIVWTRLNPMFYHDKVEAGKSTSKDLSTPTPFLSLHSLSEKYGSR